MAHPENVPPADAYRLVRAYALSPGFDRANAEMRSAVFEGFDRDRRAGHARVGGPRPLRLPARLGPAGGAHGGAARLRPRAHVGRPGAGRRRDPPHDRERSGRISFAMGGRTGVLTVLAGAACAAAVALAAPTGAGAQEEAPFLDWNPLLPGFATPYRPSRERDCVDGSNACIEETLSEMYRRFDRRYATCDHNSAFGITYIRVTEAIRRTVLKNNLYAEPKYLNHEDKVFARMYFVAFDAWARGDRAKVPAGLAGGAGRRARPHGERPGEPPDVDERAHQPRYAVPARGAGAGRSEGQQPQARPRPGQPRAPPAVRRRAQELAARYDPTVDDIDAPGTLYDDTAIFQILQGWREGVWRHAEMLAAADTIQQRRAVAEYIENYALGIAQMIKAGTTISDSSARDAHCAAYRRTHREHGGQAEPRIGRRGLRARRGGIVRVRVACPEPVRDCSGTLALTRRGRRLARAGRVALRAGESKVVRVRLTKRVRRLLVRRKRLVIRATASSPSPWGTTRTAVARGRLKRPR